MGEDGSEMRLCIHTWGRGEAVRTRPMQNLRCHKVDRSRDRMTGRESAVFDMATMIDAGQVWPVQTAKC